MTLAGKTTLVTGATGFLGGALALRLAREGAQVKALGRSPEKANFLRGQQGIELVKGDISDSARTHHVIQGCEYVFHAAVSYGDWEQQHAVNVEGTRNVMEAAAAAGSARVVVVSSIAAYGYERSGSVTEMDALMPVAGEPYNTTKIKAETAARELGVQHRLSYSIIRPGMIYGPRSEAWTDRMMRHASRRFIIWLGDGGGSVFPIHVDDVVDMMLILATHPAANGEAFNCVNTSPVTWREFLLAYGKLVHNERWLGVPVELASGIVSILAAVSPAHSQGRVLPKVLPALYRKLTIDMGKARDLLGWQPKIDLQAGIESCVPYLREKGLLT